MLYIMPRYAVHAMPYYAMWYVVQVFAATERESHDHYPYPILPVHWMSRDAVRPDMYWQYAFHYYNGTRTMRWLHAHPSWGHWALPFLLDLLHERLAAATGRREILVWDLLAANTAGVMSVLRDRKKAIREWGRERARERERERDFHSHFLAISLSRSISSVLRPRSPLQVVRGSVRQHFMQEDEDMFNVALWRDKVDKSWRSSDAT